MVGLDSGADESNLRSNFAYDFPTGPCTGLPWGFAGWLGFGTSNPYHNVTATADYTAKWVECGRDVHGLNISMLGLWNEAWVANGRPSTDAWE